jgi:NADH dehydrogenase
MNGRRVTVFGGAGFLGRHIVRRLAAQGAVVRVAVRDPEDALFLKPMGEVGQIVPMAADVADPASVRAAVTGAERVINLVGILSEWGRATFRRVHVEGAATVAAAAAEAGATSLLHVSALGADPASPSAYARTKAEGEAAVRAAFPGAVVFRPSVVFGPEDGFFNRFAALARVSPVLPVIGAPAWPRIGWAGRGLEIDLFGRGGPRFQPVYVADVADAAMAALDDKRARGRTFQLGGPTIYSFKEIMELVLKATGRKRLLAPVPYWAAMCQGFFLEWLPRPLLTRDQVLLLRVDNVVPSGADGLAALGIAPTPAEAVIGEYLSRFRRPGPARTAGA